MGADGTRAVWMRDAAGSDVAVVAQHRRKARSTAGDCDDVTVAGAGIRRPA